MTNLYLVVFYQYRENYGAHDWDGKGECPQYWKNKGGSDEVVATLTPAEAIDLGPEGIRRLAHANADTYSHEYAEQYVIGYELMTLETNDIVRVRDALANIDPRDRMYPEIALSFELDLSEALVKIAMKALEDPALELPETIDLDDSEWEWYDDAA